MGHVTSSDNQGIFPGGQVAGVWIVKWLPASIKGSGKTIDYFP